VHLNWCFHSLASKLIILLYASSNWVFSTAPYFSSAVLQLYNIYVKNHQMASEGLHKKHDGHSRSMRWIMLYHFRNILHPKLQFVLAFIHNHFLCNLLWIVWLKLALVYLTVVNTIFIYTMAHLTISFIFGSRSSVSSGQPGSSTYNLLGSTTFTLLFFA
jgi:hypothetical protein